MIIDLTYACKMGCSHCISDCKPEGENMSLQQLSFSYKNVSFLKNDIYEISVLGRRAVYKKNKDSPNL